MSYIITWEDFNMLPGKQILEDKVICVHYNGNNLAEIIGWLKEIKEIILQEDVDFDTILIFADYSKLNTIQVIELVRVCDKTGAMLTKFPVNCHSFEETIAEFIKEVDKSLGIIDKLEWK